MNANSRSNTDGNQEELDGLLPWGECDLFCIRDYTGAMPSRCGWRGRFQDVRRDPALRFTCPRCGGETLLRIPVSGDAPEQNDR